MTDAPPLDEHGLRWALYRFIMQRLRDPAAS